jgi:hypothetical protein
MNAWLAEGRERLASMSRWAASGFVSKGLDERDVQAMVEDTIVARRQERERREEEARWRT